MSPDSLRALLDAAAKATPGKWETEEWPSSVVVRRESWDQVVATTPRQCNRDYIAAASPDVVAALARIALAAMTLRKELEDDGYPRVYAETSHGSGVGGQILCTAFPRVLYALDDALRDAGLLTTAL